MSKTKTENYYIKKKLYEKGYTVWNKNETGQSETSEKCCRVLWVYHSQPWTLDQTLIPSSHSLSNLILLWSLKSQHIANAHVKNCCEVIKMVNRLN